MLGGSERDSFDARERRRVGYWKTRKGLDKPAWLGPVRVGRADASSPVADVCVGQVRAAQMEAMASRSEVQHMLQQSLLDVKQQIAARRILVTPTTATTASLESLLDVKQQITARRILVTPTTATTASVESLLDVKQQIAARRILVTPTTAATTTSLDVQNPPHTQKPPTHSTCSSTAPPDTPHKQAIAQLEPLRGEATLTAADADRRP